MQQSKLHSRFVTAAAIVASLFVQHRVCLAQENLSRIRVTGIATDPPIVTEAEEPLPPDAQDLTSTFDGEAAEIRQKAEQEIQVKRETLIKALKILQDNYTRAAKLDEAVAIRTKIRQLRVAHLKPLPNPGHLSRFANQIGESFHFEVVGRASGIIFGSDVYTCDSDLATAVVHAGLLKVGQRGFVKATLVKSPNEHPATTRNGVTSYGYGPFLASYTLEPVPESNVPPDKGKAIESKGTSR